MSAKISTARREAFFRALAETGNQTIAAERAKVSRSWVHLHRSADPGFRARLEAAVAQARTRFDTLSTNGKGTRRPPSGWGSLDGEELVVKGTGGGALRQAQDEPFDCALRLRSGQAQDKPFDCAQDKRKGRRVQIARARLKQWTPRVEARFLATLAATCNVTASCAEVGMTSAGAYAHRKRWRRFAELWDAAIAEGYARIEIALLDNGLNLFSEQELPPETPLRGMDVAQAIHLLHMHKHGVLGLGKAPGKRWQRPPSIDDPAIRTSILRKIAAVVNARDIPAEVRAADERAYALRRGPGQAPRRRGSVEGG